MSSSQPTHSKPKRRGRCDQCAAACASTMNPATAALANSTSFQTIPSYNRNCGLIMQSAAIGTASQETLGSSQISDNTAPNRTSASANTNTAVPGCSQSASPNSHDITGGCQPAYTPVRPSSSCITES